MIDLPLYNNILLNTCPCSSSYTVYTLFFPFIWLSKAHSLIFFFFPISVSLDIKWVLLSSACEVLNKLYYINIYLYR